MTPEEIRQADDSLARLQVPILREQLERLREDYLALELMLSAWRDAARITKQQRDDLKRQLADVRECNELNATEMQRFQVQAIKAECDQNDLRRLRRQLEEAEQRARDWQSNAEQLVCYIEKRDRTIANLRTSLENIVIATDPRVDECAESKLDRARDLAELGLESSGPVLTTRVERGE